MLQACVWFVSGCQAIPTSLAPLSSTVAPGRVREPGQSDLGLNRRSEGWGSGDLSVCHAAPVRGGGSKEQFKWR